MESGKSFGFILLLLLVFGVAAGAGWLAFSGTKTGVAVIDNNVAKLQGVMSAEESQELLPVDDHAAAHGHDDPGGHSHGDHSHDHGQGQGQGQEQAKPVNPNKVPGTEGKIYLKPVNPLLGVRGVGDANAPIKIREFFSLTCNHCATFHSTIYPQLKQKYIDTGKVYFIYEEFPLNGPALYGSMIARCMPEGRYESFVDLLLREQDKWAFSGDFKAALKQNAALAGMGDEEFETCFNNKELQKAIAMNIQESSDNWKISSTPSFVVNDGERIISGVRSIKDFDKVINYLSNNKGAPAVEAPSMNNTGTESNSTDINDLFVE